MTNAIRLTLTAAVILSALYIGHDAHAAFIRALAVSLARVNGAIP
jgi:hypothetical protein